MRVSNLRVGNVSEPLGFAAEPLSFSWTVEEAGEAKAMASTRVCVFEGDSCIFDSGEDTKADSLDYAVSVDLKPRTKYTWSVEVTADNGEKAEGKSCFETGKMGEAWSGQWISPKGLTSSAILKKSFTCDETKDARLYMCGLGVYECYINGKKAGDEYLAPGYHSYDFHLQTQTYDVSELVADGENTIEIWLGEGWFKGRLGFDGGFTNLYGEQLYAIAELYDGSRNLVLKTDDTWNVCESPVTFNNIYDGEVYDARREVLNTASEVTAALAEPKGCGPLNDRYSLPIKKKEAFAVAEVIHTPGGDTVLDFGQNLTGWVEFDCELPEGDGLRLTASEIMQNGEFYHDNLRTAKTEYTYISSGKAAHARPMFTFFGFRYMKVEYLCCAGVENCCAVASDDVNCCASKSVKDIYSDEKIKSMFNAYHLRSDFDQIGFIKTGDEKVNQLFSNALWGQKDNFLDVPTDCPQRDERLGWTGDAQVFSETACYNMYMPAFYRKYLWDMREEQSVLDGAVPNVVPRLKQGLVAGFGACPWADAGVIIPWNVYEHYGSKTLLREMYPGMKAWVDYQRRHEETIEGPHLIKDGFHFADWLALDNDQPGPFGATDPLYISSAYYYKCSSIIANAAETLGYDEAAEYKKLAGDIKAAISEKYFDEDGLCVCKTQTGAAMAIMFGLSGDEKAEGEALNQRVLDNNGHLNTGFVGTTLLCPALTKTGHHKTAANLLLNEDYPSWLYSVNLGATTIWERWNSVMQDGSMNPEGMNSLNHYSYGSIEAWMYGYVCGIRLADAGFKKAVIEPHADERLGFADCTLNTAAGTYKSAWKCENGKTEYKVTVPFGACAEIILPGREKEVVGAGEYEWIL